MQQKRDYYEILGVPRNAPLQDIKSSYRKLAIKYHPDRNPDNKEAEEFFKEAAEAYAVLSDSEKRELYDRYGHQGLNNIGFEGYRGFEDIFSSFGDIFGDFFNFGFAGAGGGGGRKRRSAAQRGNDLRYDMQLEFKEAIFGVEREITIERASSCETCHGSGSKPGKGPATCPLCQGRGQVVHSQGFFTVSSTCNQCHGSGKIITDPCETCRGDGRIMKKSTLSVKVPAGVDNGSRLRLSGEGEEGLHGGGAGDLYIFLLVKEHEFFVRDGDNIHCQIPISFTQAALGAEIDVPTIEDDTFKLTIPRGTQTNKVFVQRGAGSFNLRGHGRGDLLIEVRVVTPTKLNPQQETLLREFAEVSGDAVSEKKRNIFDKIKEQICN